MDLTRGCLNVISLIQNPFAFPVLVSEKYSIHPKFQANPKFLNSPSSESELHLRKPLPAKLRWSFFNHVLFFLINFGLLRVCVVFSNWNQQHDFEQLGYNALLATICGIAKSAYSDIKFHINDLVYLINQRFKLVKNVPVHSVGSPVSFFLKSSRQPFVEMFIYLFATGFLTFPLVFAGIPIVRPYDPFQISACYVLGFIETREGSLVPLFIIKAWASLSFLVIACYGAAIVLLMLLFAIMVLEAYIHMSRQFRGNLEDLWNLGSKRRFQKALQNFRNLHLMINVNNVIFRDFMFVLIVLGIVAASLGGFVMVVMYSEFPLIIYVSCSGIFFICQCVNFMLVTWAGIPNGNGKRFKQYWRGKLKIRQEKQMLEACPEIGFNVGLVHNIKYLTALTISDSIINTTATLALLKVHAHK